MGFSFGNVLSPLSPFPSGGGGSQKGPLATPNIPQFDMKKTEDFIKPQANIQIGGGPQNMARRYDALRESASNRIGAANRDASNAIQRKFASIGNSGSGAEIQAMQNLNDEQVHQKEDAMANIGAQEQGAVQQRDLAQADLDFKNRVFAFDSGSKMHELDLAERQQKIDAATTTYNAQLSSEMSRPPKQGLISGLLDGIL